MTDYPPSIVYTRNYLGWWFTATDYTTFTSTKDGPFPTEQAAQAAADRVVARWRDGSDAVSNVKRGAA